MKIVTLSDTHCRLRKVKVPEGELLLHAGDLTFKGDHQETSQELRELGRIAKDFKHGCVLVEGNHDWLGYRHPKLMDQMCKDNGITLLRDSGITIEGLSFWGAPWQPEFHNWSWNLPRGQALKDKWAQIPDNTNILITHGPPMGILDNVTKFNHQKGEMEIEHVGCVDLYNRVQELKELKLHLFGHLHDGHGTLKVGDLTYINASINTEDYKPTNKPFIINL